MRNEHDEDDYLNPYHIDKVWPDLDPEGEKCLAYVHVYDDKVYKTMPKIVACQNQATEIVWNYRFPFPKYLPLCNTCAESLAKSNSVKRKKENNGLAKEK